MSAGLRLAREVARRLRRFAIRLLGGDYDRSPRTGNPPAHWAEYVRARAPHLLEPGAMQSAQAAEFETTPTGPASPFRDHLNLGMRRHGGPVAVFGDAAQRRPSPQAERFPQPDIRRAAPQSNETNHPATSIRSRSWSWPWREYRRRPPAPPPLAEVPPARPGIAISHPDGVNRSERNEAGHFGHAWTPEIAHANFGGRAAEASIAARIAGSEAFYVYQDAAARALPPAAESVYEPPARRSVTTESFAEPFNPWPALPDALADDFDWRTARRATDDEERLRSEQGRL